MRPTVYGLLLAVWFSLPGAFAQVFSTRYELVPLSNKVNSSHHEANPIISPDGKTLYFFVANHPENTYGKENSQDIWSTTRDDKGDWQPAKHLGAPFNQNRYNGVLTVLPDGSLLVRGGRAKNSVGFSLVSASGSNWTELKVPGLEEMMKGLFNGAAISADRKHLILYFSEVKQGKFSDLYISNLRDDGQWTRPEKLPISSVSDEFAPFIGPDQKTLYFASGRVVKNRVGGVDIYKSERMDDTWKKWSEPVNLGKPINTGVEDAYFSVDASGLVFITRAGNVMDGGNLDILMLKPRNLKITLTGNVFDQKTQQSMGVPLEITVKDQKPFGVKSTPAGKFETRMPETDTYLVKATAVGYQPFEQNFTMPKINNDTTLHIDIPLVPLAKKLLLIGQVLDKKTNQPVNATVDIVYRAQNSSVYKGAAPATGFTQEVPGLGWYVINARAEGYLNGADSVLAQTAEASPFQKNVLLTPIEVGLTVRLKNIYFDFNRTTLKPESFTELNKVVEFLNQNGTVEIEIGGHTDFVGTDEYNQKLSQGRTQSVVDYLVTQGIDRSRLTARGYGESQPIDTNETDEGRANNRRVEFTVLKK
ncbi:MAG: OmpA family protein [Cyclobacteriaceae bacterium]|jgi:OOP family OmpA-OmpF porin